MVGEFTRTDRVADAIQRILARVIQRQMRDPRVHMVNINAVTVTRDIAYAKIYITLVGQHDESAGVFLVCIWTDVECGVSFVSIRTRKRQGVSRVNSANSAFSINNVLKNNSQNRPDI